MLPKQNVCNVHLHFMIQFCFSFSCDSNVGHRNLVSLDFLAHLDLSRYKKFHLLGKTLFLK